MIVLSDTETGAVIGTVSSEQLKVLTDELEEESSADRDYWINRPMLDVLREHGADEGLIALIEGAMGEREDIEIAWAEE